MIIETPVLIVGAGPVGLSAGLLLGRLGIGYRIVERRSGPQRAPAAHVVNARTFEIFRQAGVDMKAIGAACTDPADAGFVYFVDKLGGDILGRLPYEQQGDEVLAFTPTPLRNLSQHRLEPILVESLQRGGGAGPAYGQQWESAEQDDGGVCSRVRDLRSDEVYQIRSRYLLAADGAGSRVRKWLEIAQIGPERIQSFVMIHFEAHLLPLVRDCPGVLYWICHPHCGGTFVAHGPDEWVYMHPWDSEHESQADYTEAACERIVRRAIADDRGAAEVDLTIRTISTWTMTAQVAERYRDGRVFLVGDSAHRFPPTGGMGLNTGVQDAHNLVWKLAAVEAGHASAALLDTYEVERRPVAQQNAEQSLGNALRLLEVPQALGTVGGGEEAVARMRATLADAAARERVAAAIANQAEHFDMFGLQMGFAYDDGALMADGSDKPVVQNVVRDFVPSSRPGARLPHGWVERDGRRLSTLDLIAFDKLTLLAGPEGSAWLEAVRGVDPPVACVRMGGDIADPDGWWERVAQMQPDGALLVRPDQHVGFRSQAGAADAGAQIERAIAAITRR